MDRFQQALASVLKTEGGFANDKSDRGGPTNLGVTLETWDEYHGRSGTVHDIEELTPDAVAPIYRKLFWDRLCLDDVAYPVAEVLFDQTVLRGRNAIRTLQAVLGLPVDGLIGEKTLQMLKAHPSPKRLAFVFIRASQRDYVNLCMRVPDQLKFLPGWTDRLFALVERYLLGG